MSVGPVMKIKYDQSVDAAYLYLTDERDGHLSTVAISDPELPGSIHLDFGIDGKLAGIEFLAASAVLPSNLLDDASR
jgi:uncharacterized protein YuzE